ncbi:MAG: GAF domain-containing protein [Hydrogenophaga sp.]|jgi:GAF domain-containing protein|uniref:GAF domain-containing protein n=1 Tax=Hydrogenophaga sp. TaxID=1904254 RepID=UPI001D609C05|nr:GAF domain-containing protein [Hydrogenophaga sp.]MBW0168882.1 GAF domain-containing protein [Hydrogenophaga sp.]MBW0182669.1 GAF domain-containing protein [Hydrogenophaga sp.]
MRHHSKRLERLKQLMILETPPEAAYDDLTRALADGLGVPIAMVNILDQHRDWFKSVVGLPLRESSAATSFCEVFLQTEDDLVVAEDTAQDPRFAAHPMVTGEPHIRFYAAARLVVDGQTIGTLCAYDTQPQTVSPEKVAELKVLGDAVMELLRKRDVSPE